MERKNLLKERKNCGVSWGSMVMVRGEKVRGKRAMIGGVHERRCLRMTTVAAFWKKGNVRVW